MIGMRTIMETDLGIYCRAQDQALPCYAYRTKLLEQNLTAKCRTCVDAKETIRVLRHVICECSELAQTNYKKKYDKVATLLRWDQCKNGLIATDKWHEHKSDKVEENVAKILWHFNIQTDRETNDWRPGVIVIREK